MSSSAGSRPAPSRSEPPERCGERPPWWPGSEALPAAVSVAPAQRSHVLRRLDMLKHRRLIAVLGCVTALGATGAAVAADGATDIKVTAAPTLTPGRTAPFDAA